MFRRQRLPLIALTLALMCSVSAYAAITGAISGTLTDPSGAVIPNAPVAVLNEATGVKQAAVTDTKGFYSFPVLDVGVYTVSASVQGFQSYQQKGIHVDANSSVRTDIALSVGAVTTTTEVTANAVQVETQTTQMGEVIESGKLTSVPLNNRAFTDLLALQPGVSPYVGRSEGGAGAVSGSLNAGNMSINGGREASNGFMVNGGNVNDGVENGAAIIPNLDSISEFRIITSNFDAEYGNYSGGQVNVVTKNGTNQWHGSAFEFLRNTAFNAAGYQFSNPPLPRSPFKQNIFGGTFGGPIKHDRMFFFADYQGTRRTTGANNSAQTLSAADRTGNITDLAVKPPAGANAIPLSGSVAGTGWAAVLSQRLGYTVTDGEPYSSVFPLDLAGNLIIPQSAWSPVAKNLFTYMPLPNGVAGNGFPAYNSALSGTVKDDKEGGRLDINTRLGTLFLYYFLDNDTVANPYAGGSDGQFPAATTGQAMMTNIGLTTTFKNNAVNTFRFTYMRSSTDSNKPTYTTPGPSLASLGFTTPWDALGTQGKGGLGNINPALGGVPQISVDGMSFGTPTAIDLRVDNTFQWLDNYMKVVGTHTFQFGMNYHYDQINGRNNYGVNGIFSFGDANETGNGFADFLLGAPSSFTQASLQLLDSRSHYAAGYFEDSWRARRNLTLNYGVRYEVTTPWYDTQNKLETIIPGEQSKVFPGAPLGWVVPGDPGVPRTLAPIRWNKFAPRLGFDYAPTPTMAIRGGAGLFYTNFQDESGFVEIGDAPFGLYYPSGNQPMFESPYIDRGSQYVQPGKFPFQWPPTNVSASNPYSNFPWAAVEPLSGSDAVGPNNTVPYIMNYILSIQRQVGRASVFSISYSGNQGRHLANSMEANPGNPAVCLSLAQASQVKSGTTPCRPKGEGTTYYKPDGTTVIGTRILDNANQFGSNPYLLTQATGNYNSLQTSFKHTSKYWDVLLGYTWAKSMDNSSSMTQAVDPYDTMKTYGLSTYDVRHYFVGSYNLRLPVDRLSDNRVVKAVAGGWSITGITKMATGTPIPITDSSDYSLTGVSVADEPYRASGPLFGGGALGDKNPRNRNPYFNTSLFINEASQCTLTGHTKTTQYQCYGLAGNTKGRSFSGPGLDHTDLSLAREFHIKERNIFSFRLEAFNFMNHAEFNNPSGSSTSTSSFGKVTSAIANQQRILELVGRYTF